MSTCSNAVSATAWASTGAVESAVSPSSTRRAPTLSPPSSSSRTASARARAPSDHGTISAQRVSVRPRTRCPSGDVSALARSAKRRSAAGVSLSGRASVGWIAAQASVGCPQPSSSSAPRRRARTDAPGSVNTWATRTCIGAGASASWFWALGSTSGVRVTARPHSAADASQFPTRSSSSASSMASVPSPPSVRRPIRNARRASSHMRRSASACPHSRYGASLCGALAAQRRAIVSSESS